MEEQLPVGIAPVLELHSAGGADYVIEGPARDGLPEVIWVMDDYGNYDDNLPIDISSDEEEQGEFVVDDVGEVMAPLHPDAEDEEEEGEREDVAALIRQIFPDSEDEEEEEDGHQRVETDEEDDDEEEEEEEEEDDDDALGGWFADSGYETMTEDEDDDDDDEVFQPRNFFLGWRPVDPPVPAVAPVVVPEEDPPSAGRQEESAPSTSGFGSTMKRSRDEDSTEEVSMKRQRTDCEEPGPSTSGIGSSSVPAPSASGAISFTKTRFWEDPLRYFRRDDDSDSDDSD